MVQTIAAMLGWKPRRQPIGPRLPLAAIAADAAAAGVPLAVGNLDMPAAILDLDEFRARNKARAVEIARRNMNMAQA